MDYVLGPIRPTYRGEYSGNEDYRYFDVVRYKGESYICIYKNSSSHTETEGQIKDDYPAGNFPINNTDYWYKIADKGDKGDPPEQYQSFKTISENGDVTWDVNETDKLKIYDIIPDNIIFENIYDGFCGIIISNNDLTEAFPEGSILSADYYFMECRDSGDAYLYTVIVYKNNNNSFRYIWNRTVIKDVDSI